MLLITGLLGCSGTLCEGSIPRDAQVLEHQLAGLGYGEFGDSGFGDSSSRVLQDQDALDAYLAEVGGTLDLDVDFSSEVVFANSWVDGGCDELTYTVVFQDGTLRLRREELTGGCDAWFPQLDFVVTEHRDATDIDFCETVVEWERRGPWPF